MNPIHLGELLKEETKSTTTRKVIEYNDRKEYLYPRALATELTGNDLTRRQIEDKKKQDEERIMKNYISHIIEEELTSSRVNRLKLLSDWRVIMRISKIDEIRKYLTLYMQLFERDLDEKDAILHMLDRDIIESEEHFSIALTNHLIHVKQLVSLQDSRVKGLFREFDKDVTELEIEFKNEFEEIESNFNAEQNEILKIMNNIRDSYNEKINRLKLEFQDMSNSQVQKINETYGRIQENIKKIGISDNNRFNTEMNEIKQKADDKNKLDMEGIEKLNKLEKEILFKNKKVEKHNEELKQWKIKIKQNHEDWESKNDALKREKEKIMESYRLLKGKLISFRNNQREKLKKLVKNSWDCVLKLKDDIKLSEKILKLAEISRRLETEKEKILPYYESSDIGQDETPPPELLYIKGVDPILYEEIESLRNFWKRYNKVYLDVIAIRKQKNEVDKQNEVLKNLIQHYCDGFTVNNVVMTNENPLMIVTSGANMNYTLEKTQVQEASHIMLDINKQYYFNR